MMDRVAPAEVTLVTVAAVALAACGDGTGPDADLTREQAEKVAQAISQVAHRQDLGSSGVLSTGPATSPPALSRTVSADTTVEFSTTGEGTCPGGGSVSWSVDVDAHRSELRDSLSVSGTLAYDACRSTVDSSTVTLTTVEDSAFDYQATLTRSTADSTLQWSSQVSGGVEWALEGESGTCSIDLATYITVTGVGSATEAAVDATTSGRVCDRTIERSFSLDSGA